METTQGQPERRVLITMFPLLQLLCQESHNRKHPVFRQVDLPTQRITRERCFHSQLSAACSIITISAIQ